MHRFGRRQFLTMLVFLTALLRPPRPALAEEPPIGFADWVRTLYVGAAAVREVAEAGAGTDFSDGDLQALFTPEVQAMRDAVKDRTLPPGEPDGPILHLLFGWGLLPHRKLEILSVVMGSDNRATVDLTINGNDRLLALTGKFNDTAKTWQIDDIDYGGGGPDRTLRGRLQRMLDWPKR